MEHAPTHLFDYQALWWQALWLHLWPCGWALPAEGRSALKVLRAAQVSWACALDLLLWAILYSQCWPSACT